MSVLIRFPGDGSGGQRIPGDVKTLSGQWLGALRALGYAQRTCTAYGQDLEQFRLFLRQRDITLVQLIGRREVENWLVERAAHFQNTPRSVARKLSTVRMFLDWCRRQRYVRHDACEDVDIRYEHDPVVAPEMPVLVRLVESIPITSLIGIRDRALFRLMLDTAARVGEIRRLNLPDPVSPPRDLLDIDRMQTRFRKKGGGYNVAGFDDVTRAALVRYLDVRDQLHPAEGENAVFISRKRGRMSRQAIHYRLKGYARAQNIPDMYCHKLRHRRAGEVARTLGLEAAQKLCRHRSKSTTANLYGAEADEVVRAQIRKHCSLGGQA